MRMHQKIMGSILCFLMIFYLAGCQQTENNTYVEDTSIETDSVTDTEITDTKYSTINNITNVSNNIIRFEIGDISAEGDVDTYHAVRTVDYISKNEISDITFADGYEISIFSYERDGNAYIYDSNEVFNSSNPLNSFDDIDGDYVRFTVTSGDVNVDANTFDNEILEKAKLAVYDSDNTEFMICQLGTLLESTGNLSSVKSHSMYTPDYIILEEGTTITVCNNYNLDWHAYKFEEDKDKYLYCGSSGEHIHNDSFELVTVQDVYPEATHIRLELIWADGGSTINQDAVIASGLSYLKNVIEYSDYDIGTIASEDGNNNTNRTDRFYVPNYIPIGSCKAISVGAGYNITWFAYTEKNGEYTYDGTSGWLGDGSFFAIKSILDKYPNATHFRYAVNCTSGFDIQSEEQLTETVHNSKVHMYSTNEELVFCFGNIVSQNESNDNCLPGEVVDCTQRVKNKLSSISYIDMEQIKIFTISENSSVELFVYDENFEYLGNTVQYAASASMKISEVTSDYSDARFVRFSIKGNDDEIDFAIKENIDALIKLEDGEIPYSTFAYYLNEENIYGRVCFEKLGNIKKMQDGATYGNNLIEMDSSNHGIVYDINSYEEIGTITLDKTISMHSNSVCFGAEKYDEQDEFPLMYTNVYNNYSSDEDRREGICGVFRLVKDVPGNYYGQLVQLIKIGFTEDLSLWKSKKDGSDFRPYGNFVVDTDNNRLYAYVMRDSEQITRFFEFECPTVDKSETYTNIVLGKEDIISSFDLVFYSALQGVTYFDGMLYSLDGFQNAMIHVVNLKEQCLYATLKLSEMGMAYEPEAIFSMENSVVFANSTGNVYRIMMN